MPAIGIPNRRTFYHGKSRTKKFVPILFDHEDEQFIPEPVRGHTYQVLNSEDSYAKLYAFLSGQAGVTPGELGSLMTLARKQVEPLRFDTVERRTIHNLPHFAVEFVEVDGTRRS